MKGVSFQHLPSPWRLFRVTIPAQKVKAVFEQRIHVDEKQTDE